MSAPFLSAPVFPLAVLRDPPNTDECICAAGLALWRPPPPQDSRQRLQLLRQAAASGPIAPIRPGMAFANAAAAQRWLVQERDRLEQALDRVAGCLELAVRLARFEPSAPGIFPAAGADYLRARASFERQRRLIRAELESEAAELGADLVGVRMIRRDAIAQKGAVALLMSLLVAEPCAEIVANAITARARHIEAQVRMFGPLPPLSFSVEPAAPGRACAP